MVSVILTLGKQVFIFYPNKILDSMENVFDLSKVQTVFVRYFTFRSWTQ